MCLIDRDQQAVAASYMGEIMLRKLLKFLVATFAVCSGTAMAGTVVLEGSDAVSLHHDSTYATQLFSFLKSDSYNAALPVFVLGSISGIPGLPGDTVASTTLPGALFGVYSAVYVQSPGGCCSERPVSAADQAAIAAFVAAGGSVAVQDYTGGLAAMLGFDAPQSELAGYDIGAGGLGGPSCFDTEVFLPSALSKGFTQPGALGCWGHQAYDMDYFGALGFVSLVDSGREFAALGSGVWSSFLAKGGVLGGGGGSVPEPSTVLLASIALLGLAAARRRRS